MAESNMSATLDEKSLKKKTAWGFFWTFTEKFAAQLIFFVISIILARLLAPDDYSVVGIVTIFFAFANVLISGGLNTALIQKKDATIVDYSSMLWISIAVSCVIYAILFFSAPLIASLYEKPILVPVFRIMGITLIFNAFKSILCAYLSNHLQFKKFFFSTIISLVISGTVGIVMALNDFGPWALVAQSGLNVIISTVILIFMTRVRFVFRVAFKECASLFKYGWKMLVASLISVIYSEANPLLIGIKYSTVDLSYYTKGKSLPHMLNSSISDTLSAVLFPVMSKMQDEREKLLQYLRRFMQASSFLIFPMMIGFFAVSDNFVIAVLTEKWLPASIYIKAFCLVYMLDIISVGNLQVIRAIGRSDVVLIMEIVKKTAFALVIATALVFTDSPQYLGYACVINAVIAMIVNAIPNMRLMQYKLRYQIKDLLPNFLAAILMGVSVHFIGLLSMNIYLLLTLQVFGGVVIYFVLALALKASGLRFLSDLLRKKLNAEA